MFNALNATSQVLDLMRIVDIEMKRMLRHQVQGPVHVVLAYMVRPGLGAGKVLAAYNHSSSDSARSFIKSMYLIHIDEVQVIYFTQNMKNVFKRSLEIALRESSSSPPLVRTDQLLRAILMEQDSNTEKLFLALGIDRERVYNELKKDRFVEEV